MGKPRTQRLLSFKAKSVITVYESSRLLPLMTYVHAGDKRMLMTLHTKIVICLHALFTRFQNYLLIEDMPFSSSFLLAVTWRPYPDRSRSGTGKQLTGTQWVIFGFTTKSGSCLVVRVLEKELVSLGEVFNKPSDLREDVMAEKRGTHEPLLKIEDNKIILF